MRAVSPNLEFVLLAVDDDSSDLLVHEDENGAEQCRDERCQDCPPGVVSQRVDQPAPMLRGGLQATV